jgi:transposase
MDPGKLREQQKLADEQRRRGQYRKHRQRRIAILSFVAVIIGAVSGAVVDAVLFGMPRDLADRIGLALSAAPMGGLLVWFLMVVGHAIFYEADTDDGWRPLPHCLPPPDFSTVKATAVPFSTALLAAFFATGMTQATVHGYAAVACGEAILLSCLALVFPTDRSR